MILTFVFSYTLTAWVLSLANFLFLYNPEVMTRMSLKQSQISSDEVLGGGK